MPPAATAAPPAAPNPVFLVHPSAAAAATTTAPNSAANLAAPRPSAPSKSSDAEHAGSESEDEGVSEILEESPCGRWQKR